MGLFPKFLECFSKFSFCTLAFLFYFNCYFKGAL